MAKSKLKLKLNDKAIVRMVSGKRKTHNFKYGEEVRIIKLFPNGTPEGYYECDNGKEDGKWFMNDLELKKL